jgi:uncharacterized delta-60 repeat protein
LKHLFTFIALFTSSLLFAQPAGNLDPNFGNGGKVVTSITSGQDIAHGVAIQPDGKILVAGQSTSNITGKDFVVVRYNEDGSLDNTFGNNGVATTDLQLGSDDVAYSLALQADGKIVLAGYSDNGSNKDAALVRYNADGSLDSDFGTNGITITNFENTQQDEIREVKIHPLTGNIVVGGSTAISSSLAKPVVARYTSNGTLDSSFNGTGIRLLWITNLDSQYVFSVEDLAVQPNGKITAVGWRDFPGLSWDSDYWACRINSDGTMDTGFSTDGVNTYNGSFNGHDRAYAMLLKPDNSILMAGGGYVSTLEYDFTVIELNANGTTGTWSALADWGTLLKDIAYGIAEDNNGDIVLAGSSGNASSKSFALARMNAGASLDNTFGTNGKVTTTFGNNALNECFDLAIQVDNKIVAVGYTGNDFAIARYLGEETADLNSFSLLSPANLATNQNYASLAFQWSDAFGAASYEIDIDVSAAFASTQTFSTTASAYTSTTLLPNTQYYWRVRASDGTNWGEYSTVWSFTTNALENFNLITPANNSTNQAYTSLVLDWSNNLGASNYEVQLDTTQNFSTTPQSYSTSNSTYTVTLLPSKTYYWRVRAASGANWGEWSEVWNFTTQANQASSVSEWSIAQINVYPNPATNIITIAASKAAINKPFYLTDNAGRNIHSGIINGDLVTMNIGHLAAGVYFIHIGDKAEQTFRVVKE